MDSTQAPPVYTYHCLCSTLLLASTTKISRLPRRGGVGLDKAHILPTPGTDVLSTGAGKLVGTRLEAVPRVIRRDDGFEIRHLLRCTRCALVVGYHLDAAQFPSLEVKGDKGPMLAVAYLLPGGLLSTKDMVAGKELGTGIGFEGLEFEGEAAGPKS